MPELEKENVSHFVSKLIIYQSVTFFRYWLVLLPVLKLPDEHLGKLNVPKTSNKSRRTSTGGTE